MDGEHKRLPHISGARFILIGAVLAALFWFLEAVVHVYVFHDVSILHQVFLPESHEVWMRFTVVAMFLSFGVYAQRSISARRAAERAALTASRELEQIFETAADGMRIVDQNFTVLRANDTFCELCALPKTAIVGQKCYEVFRGPRCNTPGCPLKLILANQEIVAYETEKVRGDGTTVPCIVSATPFRGADGKLVGIVEDFKDISDRKRYEEELRRSEQQLRNLALHLQEVREDERTSVAREIHDELGQVLTALRMDTHWLSQNLPGDEHQLIEKTTAMSNLIKATVKSVKRITHDLRPGLLDDFGLSAAVEWQTEDFSKRTGIPCTMQMDPEDIQLETALSTAIFRVFQETLTNIARHADATEVSILLRKEGEAVRLTVRDNGRGITREELSGKRSFGLIGMRERVKSFGGTLTIEGVPGKGTNIDLFIPCTRRDNHDTDTYRG